MNKDIVKYNNDFNLLPMPELLECEMDFFMAIVSNFKGNEKSRMVEIEVKKFADMCNFYRDSRFEILKNFKSFAFKILNHKIYYKTENAEYAFVCFEKLQLNGTKSIKIKIQEDFCEMLTNYKLGFTRFELAEFVNLSGKYTKTLYRLLKQFRLTGKMRIQWDEFMRIMNIPQNKQIGEIDRDILKPALKELTKERNLFDQKRTPFKNLAYEKIKEKGTRGRGGKVIGIEFSFKPETLKNTELTDERKFDLGKLISSKWYHRALGVFEITSGDTSDKSNLIINYSLENGDCGSFKFKNFNELQLKFAEFEPYA